MKESELLVKLYNIDEEYEKNGYAESPDDKMIVNALLRHLPKELLEEITLFYGWSNLMSLKARAFRREKKEVPQYYPVQQLLSWYNNPRSRKISFAKKELMVRFEYLSWEEQHDILLAFFRRGPKTDMLWAAKKSRHRWKPEYIPFVEDMWNRHLVYDKTGTFISKIVLEHFPSDFIIKNQWRLSEILGYHEVCIRVGNEENFKIEWDRMYFPEQLYVKAKLGFEIDVVATELEIYKYLHEDARFCVTNNEYVLRHPSVPLFYNIEGMEYIVWAMGKFRMIDALLRLLQFNKMILNDPECTTFDNMLSLIRNKIQQYDLTKKI